MARAVAAFVMFVVVGAAPSVAVNPLDNDAGTGSDAGDESLVATPVGPGSHAGSLFGASDPADWYAISVPRGMVVRYSIDTNWPLYLEAHDGCRARIGGVYFAGIEHVSYAFENETWLFGVLPLDPFTPSIQRRTYRFVVQFEQNPFVVAAEALGSGWTAVEADFGPHQWWAARTSVCYPLDSVQATSGSPTATASSAPLVCAMRLDGHGETGIRISFGMHVVRAGTGSTVRVGDTAQTSGQPVTAAAPHQTGDGLPYWNLTGGYVRASAYCTRDATVRVSIIPDGPPVVAARSGHDLLRWNAEQDEPAGEFMTPGVALTSSTELSVALGPGFVGLFAPGRGGNATRPDGTLAEFDEFGRIPLADSMEGVWTFRVQGGVSAVSPISDWLTGAFVGKTLD